MSDAPAEHDAAQQCPFCLSEIPAAAVRCRYCAANIKRPGKGPSLGGFWGTGIVLVLAGLVLAAATGSDGAWFGFLIAGVGGVFLQVAVIASGVSIGMRDRDEFRHVARYHNAWGGTTPPSGPA